MLVRLYAGLLVAALWVPLAQGAPRFLPPGSQVVLPKAAHTLATGGAKLREAEQAWRQQRNDLAKATAYARQAFLVGLTEGDLRWYGTAKAALMPWWEQAALTADAHFMRGLVKQGFHDFQGGLADIDAALAQDASRGEFWSWRFAIHLLLSKMTEAAADCRAIGQHVGVADGQACQAILGYRTGQAEAAVPALQSLLTQADFQGDLAQDWLRFHLGEAQRAAGQTTRALETWRSHLQKRPNAHAVRLALVELLNAQGQHAQAQGWARVPAPSDALLVQQWLASRRLGDNAQAQALLQTLQGRFDTQAWRREDLIERPRLIFLIENGLPEGLTLAEKNWAIQQEPPDAVLLVQAALAQQKPEAARSVLNWMARTGYTDPDLAQWAQRLRGRLTP